VQKNLVISIEKVYHKYINSLEKVQVAYMFKRKILAEFDAWKNSDGRKKALVVKGLRQIGKTYSVKEFAKANYENVVYVNFKENESAKKIFDADLNVNRIIIDLSALIPDSHFIDGKTVIIFDEIQECPNARTAIKFLVENGSYLKLRNVQIGYNMPNDVCQKLKLNLIRFYLSAQNLLTIKSKDFTGVDPENPNFGYPIPVNYTFGVNVSF